MQIKVDVAIKSLKVEKGCVNMDCKHCTEHNKCNLETILEENERLKKNHQCYKCKHYVEVDNGGENTITRECCYEQEYLNKCCFFERKEQ